jgi:hypothetical protein
MTTISGVWLPVVTPFHNGTVCCARRNAGCR